MRNNFKYIVATLLILCSLKGFSQKDSTVVNQNKRKIDQLNDRLNRLIGTENIDGIDSNNHALKIDLLFKEIRQIKSELNEIKQSVDELKSIEQSTQKTEKIIQNLNVKTINDKGLQLFEDKFYVIIESDRSREGALLKKPLTIPSHQIKLIQNSRKSWYHWVVVEPFSYDEIGNETQRYRNLGFKDAWWEKGENLNN